MRPPYCFALVCLASMVTPVRVWAQPADAPAPWHERLSFSGDFRSRYEGFYQEDRTTRSRVRMRLRLSVDAEVNDDTAFHLRVASGDPGTPVSTNQTFTGFFLPKPFSLDRAYMVYTPGAAPALTFGMGKFPAPHAGTQMVFDEDLNYEGGWERAAWDVGDGVRVGLGAVQTAVNELSSADDAFMLGEFGDVTFTRGAGRLVVSIGNYTWGRADQIAVAADGPLESIRTNALVRDPDGTVVGFASRFNVVDVVVEATLPTGRPAYPIRLLVDLARNTRAAHDRDSGLWIEAEYGRPRGPRTWGAGYTYGQVEQDVTPSAFVFSDMPGTNTRLHMLEASFVPLTGLSLDLTLHLTKRLFHGPAEGPDPWLARLHAGAVVRF